MKRAGILAFLNLAATDTQLSAESTGADIVFLFNDDHTERAVGCYGNSEISTPKLDRLAREGMPFTDGQSAAVCTSDPDVPVGSVSSEYAIPAPCASSSR